MEFFLVGLRLCSVCVLGFVYSLEAILGFVWLVFGALSMLSKRTFNVVEGDSSLSVLRWCLVVLV